MKVYCFFLFPFFSFLLYLFLLCTSPKNLRMKIRYYLLLLGFIHPPMLPEILHIILIPEIHHNVISDTIIKYLPQASLSSVINLESLDKTCKTKHESWTLIIWHAVSSFNYNYSWSISWAGNDIELWNINQMILVAGIIIFWVIIVYGT